MKLKIVYVERKFNSDSVSLEKVFAQIERRISKEKYETEFAQLPFSNSFLDILKNLIFFRKPPADVYHIAGHIHYIGLVLPSKNTVLTVHDAGILHVRGGLRRFIIKKLLFDFPLKKLKYITAISEATKNELIKFTNCDAEKIRVIENPVDDKLFSATKKTFNRKCPVILQIGTAPHKNIANLARALNGVKCRLRIIGKLEENLTEELRKNNIAYTSASNLNASEIKKEYEQADIVAFCSTFEGFGLPIIEAQAMRTPVVTSNLSPMKEVAGDAAMLVEPDDFQSIRNGILRVVNEEALRINLTEKGIENAKRFESSGIAEKYENLYREIIETERVGGKIASKI